MATHDNQQKASRGWSGSVSTSAPYLVPLGLLLIAALLLFGEVLSIRPVAAQSLCGDRAGVIECLEVLHQERPQVIGLSTDGKLLEVLVSPSGSWTILLTDSNRMACLVAAGEGCESAWTQATGLGA